MKSKVFLFFLLVNSFLIIAQEIHVQKINWGTLRDVKFTRKFNPEYQLDFYYPTFGNNLLKLQGKIVEIKGYVIPVNQNVVFSAAVRDQNQSSNLISRKKIGLIPTKL